MAVPSFRALSHLIIPCNFHFLPTKRLDVDDFPRGLGGGRQTDWVACDVRTMLVYPRAKIFFGQNMKIHVYLGPVAIRMCWFFCCLTPEKKFQSWGV